MPSLSIVFEDNQYTARISNTDITYNFAGDSVEAQAQNVRGFAQTMADGNPDVGFFLDAWDVSEAELTEQLFGTTDLLIYMGNPIYTAVGDEFLIDFLDEAGAVLLSFL